MNIPQQPVFNTRAAAGGVRFLGVPTLIRCSSESTNGVFALIEQWEMPPGFGTPYHTHQREDESFYILEGQCRFICDGNWLTAGPGDFVYGPRQVPHGFKVVGDQPVRMLLFCTPGGFDGFVMAQTTPLEEPPTPPDMGRLMMLAGEYGIDIHGPLPEEV